MRYRAFYNAILILFVLATMSVAPVVIAQDTARQEDGYRGIWFTLGQTQGDYGDKYAGGLGTYTAKHIPIAIYSPKVNKTFFVYGGTIKGKQHLLIMAGYYDHARGVVPRPTVVHDKQGVKDPHDNASICMDDQGYIWVFVSGRGRARPGFKYRSHEPYSIEQFDLISTEELTYPQPWYQPGSGFLHLFTKYTKGRELYWETSPDGKTWSDDNKLAGFGGHYQSSRQLGDKIVTAFNWHPNGGVDHRTNLYFLQTQDFGKTWTTIEGVPVTTPLATVDNPALVRNYAEEGQLVYMKDVNFDADGNPVILYITSHKHTPGPEGDPRYWTIAHWDGKAWLYHQMTRTDHNYDMGSLYIEGDGAWRVLGPTEEGPQVYGTGGEMTYWISRDHGQTWEIQKRVTEHSRYNHSYARRPVAAHPDFYALWADGDAFELSPSKLYFTNITGDHVYVLPETMTEAYAEPILHSNPTTVALSDTTAVHGVSEDTWKFDFGREPVEEGHQSVDHQVKYDPGRGFGWIETPGAIRDRGKPSLLLRDMIFSRSPATLRVDMKPGVYEIRLVAGDSDYGDHVTRITIPGVFDESITLDPGHSEFVTVTTSVEVKEDKLILEFDSPVNNWVINAITIEPAKDVKLPTFEREHHRPSITDVDAWQDVSAWPDPIAPYWERFTQSQSKADTFDPTGLTRDDYLKVIAGNVDYFKQHQNADGAIVDPYRKVEWQYSTPCFALAAATLVVHGGRDDLLESAALAMDWAIETLSQRRAATAHEDFFSPQIGHALPLLKPLVDPERYARWEKQIRAFDPFDVYRAGPGGSNWNIVALGGESLYYLLGLRDDKFYIEYCLAGQGKHFNSPWGLYTEGPMAYDHFPRIWAADMLAMGFEGQGTDKLAEVLQRGALTSLFMQSPTGELPVGGRSAHHQWNEAEQCVTYEIYAAKAKRDGDAAKAATFKRAAHLALGSIKRWIRPSGELWIVKNRNDPAENHGYEGYSSHSQYNLLAVAMLAIAYEHADATEDVAEQPAPADVGGFVIKLDEPFYKVIANAGGTYILIDYNADLSHNPSGLLRVHQAGADPQLGPSDGISEHAGYHLPDGPRTSAAVGVAWKDTTGEWRRLAEYGRYHRDNESRSTLAAELNILEQSPELVRLTLTYTGDFDGPEQIIEHYTITPKQVEQRTELVNYHGPSQLVWPVLVNDGQKELVTDVDGSFLRVTSADGTNTFTAIGAEQIKLEAERYGSRNGWVRLGIADYSEDAQPTLTIQASPE